MSALLDFVKFTHLNNWSVLHLLQNDFQYNKDYKLVKVSEFLTRNKTNVIIEDKVKYKRVTIKQYNNGLFLRDIEIGKNIGTKKQFSIKKGQFLLSKIDARNGAFGVVTEEIDNAIITGNFWTYDVDYSLVNPYFLALITTTKQFMKFCQMASSGTTGRHYLKEDKFLDVKIPLPSLKIQNKLVQDYQYKVDLSILQEKQSKDKEKEIEEYLYRELGIEISKSDNNKLLSFVNFKNIERWDSIYLLDGNNIKSKYNLIPISNIINTFLKDLDNNSLRIDSKKYPTKDFKYIGMENIEKETGKLLQFQDVKGVDIKSTTVKLPKNFFLYGKLRPYLNKYYLNKHNEDNIIISSEFFVFSVKDINEQYFKYILSSSFIQNQIENHMKGARMPRIGEDTFKNLKIPLPSLEIQDKIVKYIESLKNDIQNLKKESIMNKDVALKEFEKEVFNEN